MNFLSIAFDLIKLAYLVFKRESAGWEIEKEGIELLILMDEKDGEQVYSKWGDFNQLVADEYKGNHWLSKKQRISIVDYLEVVERLRVLERHSFGPNSGAIKYHVEAFLTRLVPANYLLALYIFHGWQWTHSIVPMRMVRLFYPCGCRDFIDFRIIGEVDFSNIRISHFQECGTRTNRRFWENSAVR